MDPLSPSPALSEDYSDLIVRGLSYVSASALNMSAVSPVNDQYSILYVPLSDHLSAVEEIGYSSVPKLYTEINVVSLEASGILPVRIQSFSGLSGSGVLLGFLDSGIDYTHPAFRNADGTSRILCLWDQADIRGVPPAGFSYGTEFTKETIDRALFSDAGGYSARTGISSNGELHSGQRNAIDRLAPCPDTHGHGTAVAGIACGSPDAGEGFTGVAPECGIAFVRLKNAKQYLRTYFRIPENAVAYQEDDLMLGIRYLIGCAAQLGMPLVICMSLGTNQGGHTGATPLEKTLDDAVLIPGVCAVTGTGNEVGFDHHCRGTLPRGGDSTEIELLVDQETQGFSLELWADLPELYRLGFTSPLGEDISPLWPSNGSAREFSFLLEKSRISVNWSVTDPPDGAQLILMRFLDPSPGIWRIHIVSSGAAAGSFHLWLPIHGLVDPEIRFLAPDADTTLVIPSCAVSSIAVGAWNAYNDSLYLHSGRGYTRNGVVKPDFASPGVLVTCPTPGGSYGSITGSCASSALAAGAAALLFESGLRQNPPRYFSADELKSLFLRGTRQRTDLIYPNQSWGNGEMNVYRIFESFRSHFPAENI